MFSDTPSPSPLRGVVRELHPEKQQQESASPKLSHWAILHELSLVASRRAHHEDIESVLNEILAHGLSAAGLSGGALYLKEADGAFMLGAQYGYSAKQLDTQVFLGNRELLEQALTSREVLALPGESIPDKVAQLLLQPFDAQAALLAPLFGVTGALGVLAVVCKTQVLLTPEWLRFVRAIANQISQTVIQLRTFQQMSEGEQRYRVLFQRASDAIFVTNDEGRILDANPAASRLSGYSREENQGRCISDIVPHRFYAYVNQLIPEYRRSGVLDSEFPLRTRDRRERIVRVSGSRVAPGVYVNIVRDITEHKRAEDTIQRLAYNDALTDLPNRTALHERLGRSIANAQAQGHTLALLLMDLDHFREINDTLGHQNGDLVLKQVAGRLRGVLWESDMVARLGGDEFAVLLGRLANKDHIDLVLSKILAALHAPFVIEGVPLDVQTSIGIALYPEHGDDADTLLQRADVALYAAKAANLPHRIYSRETDHYNPLQLALMAELRQGLPRGELVLHYQPVVAFNTGKVVATEALVRWQHPSRGLLFPDTFIPAAEKTGLITPLTTWVLGCALQQLQLWRNAGSELHMSVNLSVRDLQHPDIVVLITGLLQDSGVAPQWLTLEITESAIMVDPERAKAVLTQLHDLGIRFAIDDFGIGHSSLAYLKHLPVDKMKIDKSFVIGFQDPANAAIVRATIDLAHNLGLSVTAEGVEDEATLDALKVLGCDHAQGYFLSRPQPLDQLNIWLRDSPWSVQAKSA